MQQSNSFKAKFFSEKNNVNKHKTFVHNISKVKKYPRDLIMV